MTKRTVTRTFSIPGTLDQSVINRGIVDQVTQLTNDVSDMLDGGITFDNINGSLVDIDVTSGVAYALPKLKKATAVGAVIINTYGSVVSDYVITATQDGSVSLVVTSSPQQTKLKVMVYGK